MQKMIIVIVTILIVGFLGYYLYNSAPAGLVDVTADDSSGQQILDMVAKLNTISIDQSVFASALFSNLVDYQIPLYAETAGRQNPFAAIGSDSITIGAKP